MKRCPIITAALLLVVLAGCARQPRLQSGDLIFVGLPMDYSLDTTSMADAITEATGRDSSLNLIHVAIAEVKGDSTWVIDATIKHGVDRHPLDTFLKDFTLRDGSMPIFVVKRLRDSRSAKKFVENAKKHLGEPYDTAFLPDNGAEYCSELVRDSYVGSDGKFLFKEAPMNFRDSDGNLPIYWQQLFARLGMTVPQNVMGTNPQEMSAESILKPVDVKIAR